MRNRLAIRYAIDGDLRFISHHDTLRLFERALARSRTPVRFSEGFNPRPRMSLVLPRSVGMASLDELLLVDLDQAEDADAIRIRLQAALPPGMTLFDVSYVEEGDRRLPARARYELPLNPSEREAAREAVSAFLLKESVSVERRSPKARAAKAVDIRTYVIEADVDDEGLSWSQLITPTGTARPDEVLQALGLPSPDHLHRLRRRCVWYER